jgi:hypothetical protein
LPADVVDFTLQWQMAGAFVLPVNEHLPSGCLQLADLLGKAKWLHDAALDRPDHPVESLAGADQVIAQKPLTPAEALTRQNLVRPLGLSRSWLVVRGSLAGIELAFDGTPLLAGLGATSEISTDEATP